MSTDMIWETSSTGSDDTVRLGELLGKRLRPPQVIELRADLGGGKTTFVRGLVKGFGSRAPVTSPTFTLSKVYKNKKGQEIHHFDFYRLESAGVMAAQLAESLKNRQAITVVEWGGVVADVLPRQRLVVEFKSLPTNEYGRRLVMHYPSTLVKVIEQLETEWQTAEP